MVLLTFVFVTLTGVYLTSSGNKKVTKYQHIELQLRPKHTKLKVSATSKRGVIIPFKPREPKS